MVKHSGAWTNLKVKKRTGPARSARNIFLVVAVYFFGSKSTISRFGERFRDGQYSFVSFLFAVLLLTVPPCPAIRKNGGTSPRAQWSRRHWWNISKTYK